MMRFTQINYDKAAGLKQKALREEFLALEEAMMLDPMIKPNWERLDKWVDANIPSGRANGRAYGAIHLAHTATSQDEALCALEEAYMWFGKAIRDEMIDRLPK